LTLDLSTYRLFLAGALVASFALALPAKASEAGPWRGVDAATGQLSSVAELEKLAADFPDSASVHLRLLNALLDADNAEGAARETSWLSDHSYAFSEGAESQLLTLFDEQGKATFSSRQNANRRIVQASEPIAEVPAEAQLVESVARDPRSGCLYATTVVSKALFAKCGDEGWSRIDIDEAGSLSGIEFDETSGLLWIASGILDQTPEPHPYSAVIAYDPEKGDVVRRLYANGQVALGDLMIDGAGVVYAADPLSGVIHQAFPNDDGLRAFVGPGVFRSPEGMASFPSSDLVIVSDYRYGLAAVDGNRGTVWRLGNETPIQLDGNDGLWRYGKRLIAVQNGARPMRIVSLTLSDDLLSVVDARILERAHPEWTEPVGGSIDGDALIYVATGQWDLFEAGGALGEGAEAMPTQIRRLPLATDNVK